MPFCEQRRRLPSPVPHLIAEMRQDLVEEELATRDMSQFTPAQVRAATNEARVKANRRMRQVEERLEASMRQQPRVLGEDGHLSFSSVDSGGSDPSSGATTPTHSSPRPRSRNAHANGSLDVSTSPSATRVGAPDVFTPPSTHPRFFEPVRPGSTIDAARARRNNDGQMAETTPPEDDRLHRTETSTKEPPQRHLSKLTPHTLQAVFDVVDKTHQGEVSRARLVRGLRANAQVKNILGLHAKTVRDTDKHEYEAIVAAIDADRTPTISLREFCAYVFGDMSTITVHDETSDETSGGPPEPLAVLLQRLREDNTRLHQRAQVRCAPARISAIVPAISLVGVGVPNSVCRARMSAILCV
eukprot:m.480831 g.480831  ORF g.480831 m.480831 type:complete len:357 (-) comp21711_c1_seq5:768-1838(-)